MPRPLGRELSLAQELPEIAIELSANLAIAGQAWLAPNQQARALRLETNVREGAQRIRILLDAIESGLTGG